MYFVCGESDKNKASSEDIKKEYGEISMAAGESDFTANYEQLVSNNTVLRIVDIKLPTLRLNVKTKQLQRNRKSYCDQWRI